MTPPQPAELTQSLKALAKAESFFLTGAAPAVRPPHYDFFCQWLDRGMAGTMEYLPQRRSAYEHPRSILDQARSVLMLGASYYQRPDPDGSAGQAPGTTLPHTTPPSLAGRGKIARYAWSGRDYHDWIHAKLKRLIKAIHDRWPTIALRGVVDTAPLLERDFARLAGLGWVGKNTMLIHKRAGSYFFLAALILDVELEYDSPHDTDHCGTCTRCLEACPTRAFPAPGVLDARRCVSYLTIEQRGPVAADLRSGLGDWWFGCDVCQDVCPWNRHADPASLAIDHAPSRQDLDLQSLFSLTESQFREQFRGTPMWRAKRSGALRNAAYVLGNQRAVAARPILLAALADEADPVVRGAAAWALGQIGGEELLEKLECVWRSEVDEAVRHEIRDSIERLKVTPGAAQAKDQAGEPEGDEQMT